MREQLKTITCRSNYPQSNRVNDFVIYIYTVDNINDKELINEFFQKASKLASQVCSATANDAQRYRTKNTVLANCLAGVISEYFWTKYLNSNKIIVTEPQFNSASNQIDLIIVSNNKTIEVRSSFPRNGEEFAICHQTYQFDILGPYSNSYKPGEIQKDFYVRTLYKLNRPIDIIKQLKDGNLEIVLAGGATWEMMINPKISKDKTLVPEDSLTNEGRTNYRVVPFCYALDTIEIKEEIENSMK